MCIKYPLNVAFTIMQMLGVHKGSANVLLADTHGSENSKLVNIVFCHIFSMSFCITSWPWFMSVCVLNRFLTAFFHVTRT